VVIPLALDTIMAPEVIDLLSSPDTPFPELPNWNATHLNKGSTRPPAGKLTYGAYDLADTAPLFQSPNRPLAALRDTNARRFPNAILLSDDLDAIGEINGGSAVEQSAKRQKLSKEEAGEVKVFGSTPEWSFAVLNGAERMQPAQKDTYKTPSDNQRKKRATSPVRYSRKPTLEDDPIEFTSSPRAISPHSLKELIPQDSDPFRSSPDRSIGLQGSTIDIRDEEQDFDPFTTSPIKRIEGAAKEKSSKSWDPISSSAPEATSFRDKSPRRY